MIPIIECQRKGRSNHIHVGLGLSTLAPVARSVLVDANYHAYFRMKDDKSLREAANTLLLPPGAEAILPGLVPGEFLWRGPTWPDAALARIYPNVLPPLPEDIQYDTLPYVPSSSLREMPPVIRALKDARAAHKAARLIPGESKKLSLSNPPMQFLSLACDMVGFPAVNIFRVMGKVSLGTQASVRKKLEAERLVAFEKLRIERTDKLLQEVTPDGYRLIGKEPAGLDGRGSTAHRNAVRWVKDRGTRQGYSNSVTEFLITGTTQAADNAWFNESFRDLHLFEFAHKCYTNLPDKVKTAFESKLRIEQYTIIAAQKSILKKIDLLLRGELGIVPYGNRIRFELITPYLEAFIEGQQK